MDDFAADIDAFMEAVGIDEVTLVGHSSGGLIVQRVALSYPRRVSRLVLIGSPTTLVNNEALIELGEEMLALEDPIPPEFVESTIHHPVPEEFVAGAVSECLKAPARVWRDYWEGVLLAANDTARLGEIGAPTLILWGKRDALLPHVEQELRAAAIPDATLRVYPETGHAVAGERPEWVVRDLEAFMRGTAPA